MGLISNGTTIFDNGSMASGFGGNMDAGKIKLYGIKDS